MYSQLGIPRGLDSFSLPPCEPPKGKEVLERLLYVVKLFTKKFRSLWRILLLSEKILAKKDEVFRKG